MQRTVTSYGLGICALLLLATQVACEPQRPEVRELPHQETFIALARDFQDFRSWGSLSLGERPAQGETHPGGELRTFVNALPPNGSSHYPVGTIIVKEHVVDDASGAGEPKTHFAMVKRGGEFNAEGAEGWEWFELIERDSSVAIGWRGLGAPDGEGYGGDPMGSCNGCHQMARENDYVLSKALALHR